MKKLKVTSTNFWYVVGFCVCSFATAFLLTMFVSLFFIAEESALAANFWGRCFFHFVLLIAAVAYFFLARRNYKQALWLKAVEEAYTAYENAERDKSVTDDELKDLWDKYTYLCSKLD